MDGIEADSIRKQIAGELGQREAELTNIFTALRTLEPVLQEICGALLQTLAGGGKVLVAGNGGSAAEAQHFAAELIGRFKQDRGPYAAIALTGDSSVVTALANDYGFEDIFARQVRGLGAEGDVFIAFSTSGRSPNLVRAAGVAGELGIRRVAVTGQRENPLADASDLAFRAPSTDTALIQEIHLLFTHLVCGVVERQLSEGS